MRTNNSFGLFFYPRLVRLKDGNAPLMVRITVDSERKEISLKHRIPVDRWDKNKQIVNGPDVETKSLNKYIAEVRTELSNCYRKLQIDRKTLTANAVKAMFFGEDESDKTLLEVVKYHNETSKGIMAWGTLKNYFTTEKYIVEFLKTKLKVKDIYLKQLNYKFLADFEMFLRSMKPQKGQKPCSNNTVMKHIERLRKITSMSVRNDWMVMDPFQKFKPNLIRHDRGYLSEEDVAALENTEINIEHIRIVRDLFIFSCYTGLAFMDAKNLLPSDIHIGIDGKKWIIKERVKTKINSHIPLLPKALQIIEMYKDHPKSKASGKLLPMLSNQPFNSYLKKVAVLCKINKNLTHHLARHTFATTVCLLNGISMESTSGMLGHASMRTTQIYGKILPQRISKEMIELQNKLEEKSKLQVVKQA